MNEIFDMFLFVLALRNPVRIPFLAFLPMDLPYIIAQWPRVVVILGSTSSGWKVQ